MQKIIKIEERGKKDMRNKTIIGLIMVGIMIMSVAGYAFFQNGKGGGGESKMEYNGTKFQVKEDGLWHFQVNGEDFSTLNNPKDTENITSPASINLNLQDYNGKPLYFSYDSDIQGIGEIARNLERYALRLQKVCIDACEEDLPVKNCSDNIIIIKQGNDTSIRKEDNCVYITAKGEDIAKAGDVFVFKITGII